MNQLLAKLKKNYSGFSKGQKRIADYITEHFDKAAFMTAAKLGVKSGVSESTVVRFAMELGYEGYTQLQRALQEMVRTKLTAAQRMAVTSDRIGEENILDKVLNSDIDMIKATLEHTSREDFAAAVSAINRARKLYILGVRSSAPLANFLAFYFNLVHENVVLVSTSSGSEIFESLFRIGKEDVCIAVSFPRYSKQTVNALRFVQDRGAKIIALTDSEQSPMAPYADYKLLARSDMASFVDSLVAPLSLINALIVASSMPVRDQVRDNLQGLETIWQEYQVYQNTEENSDGK